MGCRWIHRAVAAALLLVVAGNTTSAGDAGELGPRSDALPTVDGSGPFDGWLTPDTAFQEATPEPSVVALPVPLLRIPAVQTSPIVVTQSQADGSSHQDETPETNPQESGSGTDTTTQTREGAMSENTTERTQRKDPFAGLQRLGDSPPNAIDNLPRLVLMTLVVLAACLGTLLLARRWLMKSGFVTESTRNTRLQIVASLSVAPRSQLHIVRMDGRDVLVGVDSRGLQQIQIVPQSFDAMLQSPEVTESMPAKVEKSNETRSAQSPRRLFTAA